MAKIQSNYNTFLAITLNYLTKNRLDLDRNFTMQYFKMNYDPTNPFAYFHYGANNGLNTSVSLALITICCIF